MNIDDFLDQTSEQDTSDIIDISTEDTTPAVIEKKPVEAPISVIEPNVPRPTSSHAQESANIASTVEPMTVSELAQQKERPLTPTKSVAGTFVQQLRMRVSNIKIALQKKDIAEAMRIYSQLVSLTHKIPVSNVSAKHRVDTLLLTTNNDIQKIVSEQKTLCVVTSKKITYYKWCEFIAKSRF
jgi:Asp-tRNA(Asn)/Glu-tRNA(Gln) amidotransferase B subunit